MRKRVFTVFLKCKEPDKQAMLNNPTSGFFISRYTVVSRAILCVEIYNTVYNRAFLYVDYILPCQLIVSGQQRPSPLCRYCLNGPALSTHFLLGGSYFRNRTKGSAKKPENI